MDTSPSRSRQERIDAAVARVFGRRRTMIRFTAADLPGSTVIDQDDVLSVRISASWLDAVDDDTLDHVLLTEGVHRAAHSRHAYNVATDAVMDLIVSDVRDASPSATSPVVDGGTPDATRIRVRKGNLDAYVVLDDLFGAYGPGTEAVASPSRARMFAEMVRRLEAEGYDVGEPVFVQSDLETRRPRTDGVADDAEAILGLGRRPDATLAGAPLLAKVPADALMAAGSPVAERFSRHDENDRWNRSRGRRDHGRRGHRGR